MIDRFCPMQVVLYLFLLMHLVFYVNCTAHSDEHIARELKFCKQSKLGSAYSLDDLTFIQFMEGQWMWHEDNLDEHETYTIPRREKTVRQLFFSDATEKYSDYNSLIHNGFTGFLVTSGNYTDIPKNVGFLTSVKHNYSVWIQRIKHCSCVACTHFRKWNQTQTDVSLSNVLITQLDGATNKMMHFVDGHNKLIIAYTPKSSSEEYKVYAYKDNLNNGRPLNTYNPEQGVILGMFRHKSTIYFYTDKMLGTFDPVRETFHQEVDRKLAKGGVYGNKNLLNLLDLFGCKSFTQEAQPEEFGNVNTVNLYLNIIIGVLNVLLLASVITFCFLIKQRHSVMAKEHNEQKDYIQRRNSHPSYDEVHRKRRRVH